MRPLALPPNQFHRFYRGGARIDALRGVPTGEDGRPEDWVGSTATTFGHATEGLSRLPDGRVLRDLVLADPRAFLGSAHAERWGAEPALLVKLLDAGERLPVHFHPGRAVARERLGLSFGKTEAWVILEAEPDAAVHVGFHEPADARTLLGRVERQDAEEMLAVLNRLSVRPRDAMLVPAGTLHAIGAGILLLELQEPTDLSVLLEWQRFGVDTGAEHLELGWDAATAATAATAAAELGRTDPDLLTAAPDTEAPSASLLPPDADLLLPRAAPAARRHGGRARPLLRGARRHRRRGHAAHGGRGGGRDRSREHRARALRGGTDDARGRGGGHPLPAAGARRAARTVVRPAPPAAARGLRYARDGVVEVALHHLVARRAGGVGDVHGGGDPPARRIVVALSRRSESVKVE